MNSDNTVFYEQHCDKEDSYDASHVHEDIHLALGWTCVLISGATCLYAYYTPFDKSKLLTAVGLALYVARLPLKTQGLAHPLTCLFGSQVRHVCRSWLAVGPLRGQRHCLPRQTQSLQISRKSSSPSTTLPR